MQPGTTTHGHARTPEYRCWQQMRQRCFNPRERSYKHYGGRGITVCERWRARFENFLADMGHRPSPQHSIDRRDNDGDYGPDNCRWTVMPIQLRNRRTNNVLSYAGRSMVITDWAAELGIAAPTITGRLKRGWSIEAALVGGMEPTSWRKPYNHPVPTESRLVGREGSDNASPSMRFLVARSVTTW